MRSMNGSGPGGGNGGPSGGGTGPSIGNTGSSAATPISSPDRTMMGLGLGLGLGGYGGPPALPVPEFKHHADFLSRLLAATPSYMNELGNPPPGFFSDWLRRLVTKPGGGMPGGNGTPQQRTSPLGFPGQERNGGSSPSGVPPPLSEGNNGKRRKRARLSDHGTTGGQHPPAHLHHLGGKDGETPRGPLGSPSSSPGGLNPFGGTHPFWFFPPFLPSPYTLNMNMSMNMNLPGGNSFLQQQQPSVSELFRGHPDNLNLLPPTHHPHSLPHFSPPNPLEGNRKASPAATNLNDLSSKLYTTKHPPLSSPSLLRPTEREKKPPTKVAKGSSNKGSSFSISRLTSPSPTSGGGIVSPVGASGRKGNKGREETEEGNGSEPGICVDLRVSGRIWESSGSGSGSGSAPPPRSIYKPLSAFRDPSDINLLSSSRRSNSSTSSSPASSRSREVPEALEPIEPPPRRRTSSGRPLSTRYVLKNLNAIYQSIRPPINNHYPRPKDSINNHSFSDEEQQTTSEDEEKLFGHSESLALVVPKPKTPLFHQMALLANSSAGNNNNNNNNGKLRGFRGDELGKVKVEKEEANEREPESFPRSHLSPVPAEPAKDSEEEKGEEIRGGDKIGGSGGNENDEDFVNVLSDEAESEDFS